MVSGALSVEEMLKLACDAAVVYLVTRGVKSAFDYFLGDGNSDSSLDNVERNFKSMMSRADDVEKEICIQARQGNGKRKREVEVWLEDLQKVKEEYPKFVEEEKNKGFRKRILGGCESKQVMNERILDLDKRSRLFGEVVPAEDTSKALPRPTIELEGAAFQDNFQRIWELMKNDEVSRIGIHGLGGVGKSTLVEHIYKKLLENNECVFWVVVSKGCSIKMLQEKIARKLGLDLWDENDDVGERAGRLNHALSRRKKFVFILDDVWERIDLVKVGVPISMEGCKWIITSRLLKVCREMNCQKMIMVKPLSKDEAWKLFLEKLGQEATTALGNGEVEEIAKQMVEMCDGVPLEIITLAGTVSGATEIQEWRHELRALEESAMDISTDM